MADKIFSTILVKRYEYLPNTRISIPNFEKIWLLNYQTISIKSSNFSLEYFSWQLKYFVFIILLMAISFIPAWKTNCLNLRALLFVPEFIQIYVTKAMLFLSWAKSKDKLKQKHG